MEWKPIKDFEELYIASDTGLIKSIKTGKILKERKNNRLYHMVELYKNKKKKTCLVHRIIAETFIDDTGINPDGTIMVPGKHQINHKDGNKENNSITNLEWCDQSYNMREAYRLGLRVYSPYEVTDEYREKMRRLASRPAPGKEVQMLDLDGNIIETFESAADAKRKHPELNIRPESIRDAADHRRGLQTYKGFKWQFTGNITHSKKMLNNKKVKI